MANQERNVVSASTTAAKLPDGVIDLDALGPSDLVDGCRVFTHYNGPTDQLSGLCAGMCVLEPGSSPHPPHRHPEEEFLIIARTEALIAGLGHDEALRRARAYGSAGADMVLVHSKQKTPIEIERFAAAWDGDPPLVVIPTAYPQLNEARMKEIGGIGMVIYGNHGIRATVKAMRDVFAQIARSGHAMDVASSIASVEDVFAIQEMDRINAEERRFVR